MFFLSLTINFLCGFLFSFSLTVFFYYLETKSVTRMILSLVMKSPTLTRDELRRIKAISVLIFQ